MKKLISVFISLLLVVNSVLPALASFPDVGSSNPHKTAIEYLQSHNILEGYSDGTFRPDFEVNRAELVKIVVAGQGIDPSASTYKDCFSDVGTEWFAPYICYAKEQGWIQGYQDGTFMPGQIVNRAEAAKIILNAIGIKLSIGATESYSDVPASIWYELYATTILHRNLLSLTTFEGAQGMTRGEVAEMLFRILVVTQLNAVEFSDSLLSSFDSTQTVGEILGSTGSFALESYDVDTFFSNGDLISGWYWLRDSGLADYAEWTINDLPQNPDGIELDLYVLATNTFSGGSGYDASFTLYYGSPDNKNELESMDVLLENDSPAGDPVGYNCHGTVTIPSSALNGGTELYVKVTRPSTSSNHIAFKKETIENVSVSGGTSGGTTDGTTGGGSTDGVTDTETDSDNDGLPDSLEDLYGTDANDSDSDNDGVKDGADISALINPSEPTINDKQKIGMIRIELPVEFYGLDGWVEKFHEELTLSGWKLYLDKTYETEGSKKSSMTETKYKEALNMMFEDSHFTAYKVENKTPLEVAVSDTEMTHDYDAEDSYTFEAGLLTPNEYKFSYDYITDYRLAYLKNDSEMRFPSETDYFRYLLFPVKVKTGYENTIKIQFKDTSMYNALSFTDDTHYKVPGFMFAFYSSNSFDTNSVVTYYPGITTALINEPNVFETSIVLPKSEATYANSYIKITPVWIQKNGSTVTYNPLIPSWNVTGLTRSISYLNDTQGSSKVITEEFNNFDGLNITPKTTSFFTTNAGSENMSSLESDYKVIKKDPNDTANPITLIDATQTVMTYLERTGSVLSTAVSYSEIAAQEVNKVSDIADLPTTHWARSPKFNSPVAALTAINGIVSIVSNGTEAWLALQDGNYVDVTYYSLQAGISTVSTASSLVQISERTVGYAGKAGKFAKLGSQKVGVGIAVAVGVVEVAYNSYKLANTNDPILKTAYAENIASSSLDTGLSVASVLAPQALAFQLTWTLEAEIYSWIFGEDFAYSVASSPGSAMVFLVEYFLTDIVPSQMAEEAYENIRDDLIEQLTTLNATASDLGINLIYVFVDPDL